MRPPEGIGGADGAEHADDVGRVEDVAIVQVGDPRAAALLAAGWEVVGESWGARLRLPVDPTAVPDRAAVLRLLAGVGDAAQRAGYVVAELGPDDVAQIAALERSTQPDYPQTPATPVPLRTEADFHAMVAGGTRFFGACVGNELVAVTAVTRGEDRADTEHTSVRADHRRRGLAVAVKAASVLALAAAGTDVFGTGGAGTNTGSIRMNERLGYVIEERWLSLRRGR